MLHVSHRLEESFTEYICVYTSNLKVQSFKNIQEGKKEPGKNSAGAHTFSPVLLSFRPLLVQWMHLYMFEKVSTL